MLGTGAVRVSPARRPPTPQQRQPHRPARLPAPPSPDLALERRRRVYKHRLFSLHIGANRTNLYRDVNPQDLVNTAHRVSRARLWIRRELQVFNFLFTPSSPLEIQEVLDMDPSRIARRLDNAEFLLEYIIAILQSVDIQDSSGQAQDLVANFLGQHTTPLFLHELRSWLRSPHSTLAQWDRDMQYPPATSRGSHTYRVRCNGDYRQPPGRAHRRRRWSLGTPGA